MLSFLYFTMNSFWLLVVGHLKRLCRRFYGIYVKWKCRFFPCRDGQSTWKRSGPQKGADNT